MSDATLKPTELALEQSGLEFLRFGKFRKARDAFKALNKSQPSRALPLLIEANLGLANEMMAKGLVSEANQVLAYLKTIAPASYKLDPTPTSKEASRDAWSAMVPLAAQRLESSTQPEARVRAADEMILGAESPEFPGHSDAKAILSALEIGYGAAFTEQTAPLLRTIPRSSPFSHWVFFFKGMTAFESGDHARAADYFRKVPENSLLQSSLPALLTLCGVAEAPQPAPQTVRALCAWADHPSVAEPLLLAEPLWRSKRRTKAFTLLAQKIPNLMCWGARGFKADLTRFLTSEYANVRSEDFGFGKALSEQATTKAYSRASAAFDRAYFSVEFADFSSCAHGHFSEALARLNDMPRVVPISPAMLSRIFTRLAEQYIASAKSDPEDACSPPNAKKALEQAIKHDPDHLHAWLMLCDLLSMGKDTSAYHRFLDDLTKRFPTEKEVLIRNGDCCIGRSSHTKALRNFQSAAEFDSVDPRIARGIMRARLGIAEAAYRKGDPSKVNWDLIDSLASSNQSCPEFSPWRLRARQIVMEVNYIGREEVFVNLTAAALPLAPSPFLFETACRIELSQHRMIFKPGILDKMFPSRPGPQSLADFLAVIDEAELAEDGEPYDFARNAARAIFAEHPVRLLETVRERKDLTALLLRIFSTRMPSLGLASPVIEKWLARDPFDPILRCICINYHFPWLKKKPNQNYFDIAAEINDSRDPDNLRLLKLLEKNRMRSGSASSRGNRRNKAPKIDLDYDPHGKNGEYYEEDDDDENEEDDYRDNVFAAVEKSAKNMSSDELLRAISGILGDGPGGFKNPAPKIPATGKPPVKRSAPGSAQLDFESQIIPPPKP